MNEGRITNIAAIDLGDMRSVRAAVSGANDAGHWRRVLAIYGDHLTGCALRRDEDNGCTCGWDAQWSNRDPAGGEITKE